MVIRYLLIGKDPQITQITQKKNVSRPSTISRTYPGEIHCAVTDVNCTGQVE